MQNIDLIFASIHKFTSDAVKKTAKSAGFSCYTLNDDSEFNYIFDDLKPAAFICMEEFYEANKTELTKVLLSNDMHVIICSDEIKNADGVDEFWAKDIDLFNLGNMLEKLLKDQT